MFEMNELYATFNKIDHFSALSFIWSFKPHCFEYYDFPERLEFIEANIWWNKTYNRIYELIKTVWIAVSDQFVHE